MKFNRLCTLNGGNNLVLSRMKRFNAFIKNSLLVLGAVALVFGGAVLADRLLGAVAAPPALPPGTLELIFPPKAEQSYASIDFSYTAYINSLGLRDREIPRERSNAFRIIAIGDSYTYGWGINIEQTWLRLLEQNLKAAGLNVETINLGKPGSGPPDYAKLAEKAIPLLRPDLVIVGILQGNDLAAAGPEVTQEVKNSVLNAVRRIYPNFVRMMEDMRLKRDLAFRTQERPPEKSSAEDNRKWAANTAQEFFNKMSPENRARFESLEPKVKEAFLSGNLNPYMIDLALQNENIYSFTLKLDDPWIKSCMERMGDQLRRIKTVADHYQAHMTVLSIPDGPYVNANAFRNIQRIGYKNTPEMLTSDAPDKGIQSACDRAGASFLQVTQTFRDHKDEPNLFFELDGHLTANGHRLFADAITPLVKKEIEALKPE